MFSLISIFLHESSFSCIFCNFNKNKFTISCYPRNHAVSNKYNFFYLLFFFFISHELLGTRAIVKTFTSFAPACKSVLQHSLTVAPVVNTSSTRQILLSLISSCFFIANAARRLCLRMAFGKPVCGTVSRTLISAPVEIGGDD